MNLAQNGFAHLRKVDHFANLVCCHVIKVVPLKLGLFLNFSRNLLQVHHVGELTQGGH